MTLQTKKPGFWAIFAIFLQLGLTSFGGPSAHFAYFRAQFVSKRAWLNDADFAALMALCQFLPGPASSQLGIAIGLQQGGYPGALAAWLGFTLPSVLLMLAFAVSLPYWPAALLAGALHGLKLVAVAVVAHAVFAMMQTLCNSRRKTAIMLLSCTLVLWQPLALLQPVLLLLAAFAGYLLLQHQAAGVSSSVNASVGKPASYAFALLFAGLLVALPLAATLFPSTALTLFDIFYRAGALVFGGGHVVLPLLQAELVPTGLVSADQFIAGYAAVQAVPGPLFSFAAYIGAVAQTDLMPAVAGLLALTALFLPAFFVLFAVLPHWQRLSQNQAMRAAVAGIGAAVTGLLLASLMVPLASSSIFSLRDAALAVLAFAGLQYCRLPPWLLVLAGAATGMLLY